MNQLQSGINTGLAVADAADSFMGAHGVTGDVINVASRLIAELKRRVTAFSGSAKTLRDGNGYKREIDNR